MTDNLPESKLVIDIDDRKLKNIFYNAIIANNYDLSEAIVNVLDEIFIKALKEKYDVIKKIQISKMMDLPRIYIDYYHLIGDVHKKSNIIFKTVSEIGFLIQRLEFEILFKDKLFIKDVKINSKYIKQYAFHYDYLELKDYKENRKYYVKFNFIQFVPELFKDMFIIENCQCEHLLPIFNYNPPLIYECPICGKKYACECQRHYYDAIKKGLSKLMSKDKIAAYNNKPEWDSFNSFEYKKGICFICNKQVPPAKFYSSEANEFSLRYAPYIKAREKAYYNGYLYDEKFSYLDISSDITKEIHQTAENEIRELVGYPLIGEKWINETTLYKIIKVLYPDYKIIREYSPDWLNRQRIDIYIKELNIAVEYQGEQHYKPIKHFGGEEGLKRTQERDKLKEKLCNENDVKIVYFNYTETLSEKLVKNKIEK